MFQNCNPPYPPLPIQVSARALQPNWTRQTWPDIYGTWPDIGAEDGEGREGGGDVRYYWLRGGPGGSGAGPLIVEEEGRFDGQAFRSAFDPMDY